MILEAAIRVVAQSGVRGLRIEKIAAEASISTALIYYHFGSRAGLIRRTLEYINDRAARYTEQALVSTNPRAQIEQMLLLKIQGTNSAQAFRDQLHRAMEAQAESTVDVPMDAVE